MFILYLATLVHSFISPSIFSCGGIFRVLYIQYHVICKWQFYFFLPKIDFSKFLLIWLLWLGLPVLCWVRSESGHPSLVADLKRNACTFCLLSMMLTVGLSYMVSIMCGYVPSIPTLLRVFYHEWMLDFIKCFFCIYSYDCVVFILHFVYVVNHIYWFANVVQPCTPRINPTWSQCEIYLMYHRIQFANILLRILTSMFINDIGL